MGKKKTAARPRREPRRAVAGFIVDNNLEVREFIGHTGPLLALTSGAASLNIEKIVRPDLRPSLVRAIQEARSLNRRVRSRSPNVWLEGRFQRLDFEVLPQRIHPSRDRIWKVLAKYRGAPQGRLGSDTLNQQIAVEPYDERIARLRREFTDLLEEEDRRHRTLLSELETSRTAIQRNQGELEAAYVELEASNAELRATLTDRDEAYSKLKETEAAAVELVETAAQGVVSIDAEERIRQVNQSACQMFGYNRDELLSKKLAILIPKGFKRRHSQDVAEFFRNPKRRTMGAGRILSGRRKDGSVFPIEVGLSSVALSQGRLAVAFISDVSEQKRTDEELQSNQERLRQLARQVTSAAEDQNRRWARELHDVYSQQLVSIAMKLSQAAAEAENSESLRALEQNVQQLARDIHSFSRRLHPTVLHDLGLVAALKAEAATFEREHAIVTTLQTKNVPRVPERVALCLYRVVQESLRNIHKHSRAQSVHIQVTGTPRSLSLAVEDIGDGFELEKAVRKGGLGLVSMEERVGSIGGEFSVQSTPGEGTRVKVTIPLKPASGRKKS